ncbi:hypothetical protein [Microseira wollei]|nr:hypothetical protein [Microseira wollei]
MREGLMDSAQAHQKCLEKLIWAMGRLEVEVALTQLYTIADLIVQPMTGYWRYFHTPQHVIEVGGNEDGIEVLAALFHDLVYVQVDCSINFNLSYYITPFIKQEREKLRIRETFQLPADATFEMVACVFGFVPGQVLDPFAGENEFLSALVATKVLEPFFSLSRLMEIAACVEATIPFRTKSKEGLTASDRLYQRLLLTNHRFNLGLSLLAIEQIVKRAQRVGNRDVSGFAHPSSAYFLANTWNLLPETNHNFISRSYTVREYRMALQKMESFMNFLQPEAIFNQFRGEPDDLTYSRLQNGARRNIEIARLYLGSKLVSIALMESLAFSLGFDVSLATLMGELPYHDYRGVRLETFLPKVVDAYHPKNDLESEVLDLLENGRANSATADLKDSPLAAFIVKSIGFEYLQEQSARAKEFFKGNLSAVDFISSFDGTVTRPVVDALLKLFENRKSAINRYYQGIISDAKPKRQTNSEADIPPSTHAPALDTTQPSYPQD